MPFHWTWVIWSWLKPTPTGGGGKWMDQWEEEPYEVEHLVAEGIPSYFMKNQQTGCSWVLHQNWLFLITPTAGTYMCTVVQAKWSRCTNTALEEQTPEGSKTKYMPQSANCPSLAQHQTGETSLGWVNRKLCVFMWMFSRASWIDKGWKVWCIGIGCVWKSMLAFWQWRYWSHWWGLKDTTGHNYFNPTSFHSRDCKLTTWGWEMDVLAHASFFGATTSSWIQMPWNCWCSPCKGPHTVVTLPNG